MLAIDLFNRQAIHFTAFHRTLDKDCFCMTDSKNPCQLSVFADSVYPLKTYQNIGKRLENIDTSDFL